MKKIIDEFTDLPLTRGQKRYLRHKEKERERSRKKYIKFRSKILERGRLWREKNPGKMREYYLKSGGGIREYSQECESQLMILLEL